MWVQHDQGRIAAHPEAFAPGLCPFLVAIQVEALDRKSLLYDVTKALSENHVNILSAQVHTSRSRLAISRFSFEMGDTRYLDHVLNQVRRIDGVYDVYRTSGNRPISEPSGR